MDKEIKNLEKEQGKIGNIAKNTLETRSNVRISEIPDFVGVTNLKDDIILNKINPATNNYTTYTLNLQDLRKFIKKTSILYLTWKVLDGHIFEITEENLDIYEKIVIQTEDLSILLTTENFEIVIPTSWDSNQGCKFELDYENCNFENPKELDIKNSDGFVLGEVFLAPNANSTSNYAVLGEYMGYAIKFDILNNEIRNVYAPVGFSTSTTINQYRQFLPSTRSGIQQRVGWIGTKSSPPRIYGGGGNEVQVQLGNLPFLVGIGGAIQKHHEACAVVNRKTDYSTYFETYYRSGEGILTYINVQNREKIEDRIFRTIVHVDSDVHCAIFYYGELY